MTLITHQCPACKTSWSFDSALTKRHREQLASLREDDLWPVRIREYLQEHTELDPISIKSIYMHLSHPGRLCCNCLARLSESGIVYCQKCGSLNYHFGGVINAD
jgi:hypothetical protein